MMKLIINKFKIFPGLLTIVLFFTVFSMTVSAATETVGDYQYNISNGIATIAKYKGKELDVTVPTEVTINGMRYKVSKIEASAFANNTTMTNLVIPKGITNIGKCAFQNCTSLTSIKIEGDITDCTTLTEVRKQQAKTYIRNQRQVHGQKMRTEPANGYVMMRMVTW